MKSLGAMTLGGALLGAAAAALLSWTAVAETKPKKADDDEPVGWPLTKRQQQEFRIEERRTPLPGNTEATTRALKAWPDADGDIQDGTLRNGAPAGEIKNPEIAPLQRFVPPFRPRRFTYEGDEFALTVARAAELDKIALRLRTSGEVLEILAYAAETTGADTGAAKLSTHDAVKLAFKRGMIVRLYLLDEGVRADQITLRALPAVENEPDAPSERVDIDIADKSN